MSDDMTFGERLRAARFVSGVTRAELARRIGRDPRIVTAWEQERHKPEPAVQEMALEAAREPMPEGKRRGRAKYIRAAAAGWAYNGTLQDSPCAGCPRCKKCNMACSRFRVYYAHFMHCCRVNAGIETPEREAIYEAYVAQQTEEEEVRASAAQNAEHCTACGEIIPEGRQVCPTCMEGADES